MIIGIDWTHWNYDNGNQNVDPVKAFAAGYRTFSVKLTEGNNVKEKNKYPIIDIVNRFKDAGFQIQYWHFCRPGNFDNVLNDAFYEYENFFRELQVMPKPDLANVIDIEEFSTEMKWPDADKKCYLEAYIDGFMQALKPETVGAWMYSYKYFLDQNLKPNHKLGKYKLWLSDPNVKRASDIKYPIGWISLVSWQKDCKGKVPGINGLVDIDVII